MSDDAKSRVVPSRPSREMSLLTLLTRNMALVAPSRLAALACLRSTIFQSSYNPTSQRTGAKYLKRRLRGPSMIEYYPNQLSITALNEEFPGLDLVDEYEVQRLQDVADKKKRGKGAPKKAKSAGTRYCLRYLS